MVLSLAKHVPRFRGNDSCTPSFVLLEPLKQEAENKGRNSVFCILSPVFWLARFCPFLLNLAGLIADAEFEVQGCSEFNPPYVWRINQEYSNDNKEFICGHSHGRFASGAGYGH
jgi:hypothetical protein